MPLSFSRWFLALAPITLLSVPGRAEDTVKPGVAPAIAKCLTSAGALLSQHEGQAWQPVKVGDALRAQDMLVALPQAEILSADGAVLLGMKADIGHRGPFPVLESAVTLKTSAGASLDVTLDRGIITLSNQKEKGAAKVRLRFRGQAWDVTLSEPGAKVGLEFYARHPSGLPALVAGKVGDPTTDLFLLVLHGSAFLDTPTHGYRLVAPPGTALVHWDSVSGELEVQRLEKLPESLMPRDDTERKQFDAICASTRRLTDRPLGTALDELLKSEDRTDRQTGVTVAGAVDDLPRLLRALADSEHSATRDQAILVLRHWMGRGPGQVGKLHKEMKNAGYSDVRARTVLQLLFGFDDEDRGRPATYELLIGYLKHDFLPIRELARWHLVRLAPAGRDIPYDAAAPEARRQTTIEQWQTLIPPGRLPARPQAPPKSR